MLYLGFVLTIISYFALIILMIIYTSLIIKKKWSKAVNFEMFLFATSLTIAALTSWSMIIMNGGFNVNAKIYISYVPLAFAGVALVLLVVNSNILNLHREKKSTLTAIGNFLLPALTLVAVLVSTVALSYNVSYYVYLMS